jgi:hypothetical protein
VASSNSTSELDTNLSTARAALALVECLNTLAANADCHMEANAEQLEGAMISLLGVTLAKLNAMQELPLDNEVWDRVVETRALLDAIDLETWRAGIQAEVGTWRLPKFAPGLLQEGATNMRSIVSAMSVHSEGELP